MNKNQFAEQLIQAAEKNCRIQAVTETIKALESEIKALNQEASLIVAQTVLKQMRLDNLKLELKRSCPVNINAIIENANFTFVENESI